RTPQAQPDGTVVPRIRLRPRHESINRRYRPDGACNHDRTPIDHDRHARSTTFAPVLRRVACKGVSVRDRPSPHCGGRAVDTGRRRIGRPACRTRRHAPDPARRDPRPPRGVRTRRRTQATPRPRRAATRPHGGRAPPRPGLRVPARPVRRLRALAVHPAHRRGVPGRGPHRLRRRHRGPGRLRSPRRRHELRPAVSAPRPIRTVLIDNYGSFTYHLSALITRVNGIPPRVLTNDRSWDELVAEPFDNIVIAPGPGRPDRARDFGISARALTDAGVPLLGVCLGHQGLCQLFGSAVITAPEPVHGRTSPILHDGTGLFAGLPSPFEAVRYHSLIADPVPDELVATAHTPDGLLMAVAHRHRPLWGVQFHPESIGTAHGAQ